MTTDLRDEIAEALMRWAERNNDPKYAPVRRPETVRQNAYGRADAVLAVIAPRLTAVSAPVQPPATRADDAAVRDRVADAIRNRIKQLTMPETPGIPSGRIAWGATEYDIADAALAELRRMAAEEQPAEVCGRTMGVSGDEYPPCARRPNHREAYCRSADGKAYFLAALIEEQPTTEAPDLHVLAAALDGLETLIATSSRDWGTYRVDAWLWAVLCGWDCEEAHEHDETCDNGAAMAEMQQRHGWDDDTVAKARRYRAAVRALTAPAPVAQQPAAEAPCTLAAAHESHEWLPFPGSGLVHKGIARCPGRGRDSSPAAAEQQPAAADTDETAISPTAELLATRCDACRHTLNRHSNHGACTVVLCVCGSFQYPAEEPQS